MLLSLREVLKGSLRYLIVVHLPKKVPTFTPIMTVYAITGANRGLGLEFVRQLASNSKNTIIAAVRTANPPPADLASIQKSSEATIHILQCDTGSPSSIAEFGKAASAALGSDDVKIDYVLNNAGVQTQPQTSTRDLSLDDLTKHIAVNVFGPAKVVDVLYSHLQSGSVVMNMSSGLASIERAVKESDTTNAPYSISKAALSMLTVHQAAELKDRGVKVFSMDPGWVKTDMGGPKAPLEPEESIKGMLKVIHGTPEAAKFYHYTGSECEW